jgi:hypothetical protein
VNGAYSANRRKKLGIMVVKFLGTSGCKWRENLNRTHWLKTTCENDTELRDSTKYGKTFGRLNSYKLLKENVVDEVTSVTS